MLTFITGSAYGRNQPATACPASCHATVTRSRCSCVRVFFSRPPSTRSTARSRCDMPTEPAPSRAAISAASLHTFAISAPLIPGVSAASRFASSGERSCPPLSVSGVRCSRKICSRPEMSGLSTEIWRSKRPGRVSALSSTSGLFVPARMITPALDAKPSISTSSWLSVFSRSSLPPPATPPRPRARPTASISSMKMRHGAALRASANMSRTRAGPTPTNISMKSDPETEKKGRSDSPATALASSVLPQPGGPTSSAPFGILAPSRV
mmetsp:Transcript_11058/g.34919  ORF Transcript_11058/g.34919 Transcript_11058/m.34919 type:complete len:267 (+) Transcript_11058:1394-2194(+)